MHDPGMAEVMSDDNTTGVAYIKGQRVELTREPPERKPGEREAMDDALERLRANREGESIGGDREPVRDIPTTDDAYEDLQSEKQAAVEQTEQAAENERREREQQADAEVEAAREWHDDDKQVLGQLETEAQDFNQRAARLVRAQQWAQQNADRLSGEDRQWLASEANELRQKQQQLQEAHSEVSQAAGTKAIESERRKLYRDIPELRDEKKRRALIDWAVSRGVPRDEAEGETRRSVITKVWNEYQKEQKAERERKLNRPRPVARRDSATPDKLTTQQARDQLKARGRMTDAVNLLHVQRQREAEDES